MLCVINIALEELVKPGSTNYICLSMHAFFFILRTRGRASMTNGIALCTRIWSIDNLEELITFKIDMGRQRMNKSGINIDLGDMAI